MKLFHLSDLHIGKRVNEFSMLEDQKYILMQILKAAKEFKEAVWQILSSIVNGSFRMNVFP